MVLTYYPFFIACFAILSIIFIAIINLILFSKYKKSITMRLINICSVLFIASTCFYLLAISVQILPISQTYLSLSKALLGLGIFVTIIAVINLFIWKLLHPHARLSPNLVEALSQLEDIVFIIDSDQIITPINHFEEFNSILCGAMNLNSLTHFLSNYCSNPSLNSNIEIQKKCEFYLPDKNKHYLIYLTPIYSKNNIEVGYTGILSNITELKKQEQVYHERNLLLEDANIKLENSVLISGALAFEKERLEIIEHIQNHLIKEIESSLISLKRLKNDEIDFMKALKAIILQLREIYSEVRRSVDKISRKDVHR